MLNLTTNTNNPFSIEGIESIHKFDSDPLVCSVSAKDLVDRSLDTHYSLQDDIRVKDNITPAIEARAEEIRKYYTKRFFWDALKNGKPLSPIRTRMVQLLENRIVDCNDNDVGIYYKLPYFYEEDQTYEEFSKLYNNNTAKLSPLGNKRSNKFVKRLKFVKSTKGIQKNVKSQYFWFADDNKDLYNITIELGNPLLSLFEQIIENNPVPLFQTYLKEARLDKLHYYKLHSFTLLKELNA
jgi:hypothetical protein